MPNYIKFALVGAVLVFGAYSYFSGTGSIIHRQHERRMQEDEAYGFGYMSAAAEVCKWTYKTAEHRATASSLEAEFADTAGVQEGKEVWETGAKDKSAGELSELCRTLYAGDVAQIFDQTE